MEALPPIQAHWLVDGLNSHKSFSSPKLFVLPLASQPKPPKSHKLPFLSIQVTLLVRLPGVFPGAGVPKVPDTPDCAPVMLDTVLLPLIHAHLPDWA
jgi:hypothetical protein